jgi:hypothetical protein
MKTKALLVSIVLGLVLRGATIAHGADCRQFEAMAEMARASSVSLLQKAKQRAGDDYRAQLVYAYRAFQLQPNLKSAAAKLLALIPKNEAEQAVAMTLGDSLCDGEFSGDMFALSRVNEGLGRQFTRAVRVAPEFLPAYVEYSLVAFTDPHSDYAVQMETVCQDRHSAFLRAFNGLPADKQARFARYVMRPDDCHVIAVPEAEK